MTKRKLLFTGASGFLGSNILASLSDIYEVDTIGLSEQDTYRFDLSKEVPFLRYRYDIVLHAAGKAHLDPSSEEENQSFFEVNLLGTKNLCAALEKTGCPKSFIFISTVAVYGLEFGIDITEEQPLNGTSPYALSKILAEQYLQEWCKNNVVILGILRPSLIAGKHPPGNLGRMIRGIKSGTYFRIGVGQTRRSVLMANDIPVIIIKLSEVGGIFNISDDYHPSFAELETLISIQLGKKTPISIPYWIAKMLALIGDISGNMFPINTSRLNKIMNQLTFSNKKAKSELNWKPIDVLTNFRID